MKWNIERKALLVALSGAEIVVQEKLGFSTSSTVCITADPENVRIIANNSETAYSIFPGGEVVNTGSLCVSHARLNNTIKEMPDGLLELSCDDELVLYVQPIGATRQLSAAIKGISAEDFPPLPVKSSDAVYVGIEKSYFRKMVGRVSFAVAAQATKYALNAILLECKDGKLSMVASDGRRLAVANMFLADKPDNFSMILPHSFVTGMSRLLNGDGVVQMHYGLEEGRVYFSFDKIELSAALVGGEYPAYEEFLPKQSEKTFTASASILSSAVKMGSVLYDSAATPKLVFSLDSAHLTLDAEEKNYGKVKEEIAIEYANEPIKIAFNAKLLLEILRSIESEKVEFGFSTSESPVIIKENMSSDAIYVLMPMRLPEEDDAGK